MFKQASLLGVEVPEQSAFKNEPAVPPRNPLPCPDFSCFEKNSRPTYISPQPPSQKEAYYRAKHKRLFQELNQDQDDKNKNNLESPLKKDNVDFINLSLKK